MTCMYHTSRRLSGPCSQFGPHCRHTICNSHHSPASCRSRGTGCTAATEGGRTLSCEARLMQGYLRLFCDCSVAALTTQQSRMAGRCLSWPGLGTLPRRTPLEMSLSKRLHDTHTQQLSTNELSSAAARAGDSNHACKPHPCWQSQRTLCEVVRLAAVPAHSWVLEVVALHSAEAE
jgi:hypothetical protein